MNTAATKPQSEDAQRIAKLEKKLLDLQLDQLAHKTSVNPKRRDDFKKLMARDHFALDEDGDLITVENGEPSYVSPEMHVSKLRANRASSWPWETDGNKPYKPGQATKASASLNRATMDTATKAQFIREHGAAAYERLPYSAPTVKRAAFDAMSQGERMDFVKGGGQVVD